MWIAFWFLAPIYVAVSFVFFLLSATELLETEKASVSRLCLAMIAAVFWPITLVAVSVLVKLRKPRRPQPQASEHIPATL